MRIITGKYKGRNITTVPDKSVRPATDRVKSTIFNVLQNRLSLHGIQVLDLFAGSGNLGFEALSRGAANILFVEDSRLVMNEIRSNAERLGCSGECEFLQSDALSFMKQTQESFDLIFADPPYAYEEISVLPALAFTGKLLKKEGFLIIEHSKQTVFAPSPNYLLAVQKEFGNTRVSFFTHSQQ
jgi:16S rRNA (guanine(966)-N(2))-methyltransferase RsmD